jgi:hypothetical protein
MISSYEGNMNMDEFHNPMKLTPWMRDNTTLMTLMKYTTWMQLNIWVKIKHKDKVAHTQVTRHANEAQP